MNPKPEYDTSKFRAPKKKKGAIYAANIGFRAPKETRERLEWLVRCLNYSANRVLIEAIDGAYYQIHNGPTYTPEYLMRARDLMKYVR